MKFMPSSRAVVVAAMTSSRLTERNSAPSDEAPKERVGRLMSVLPSGLVSMGRVDGRGKMDEGEGEFFSDGIGECSREVLFPSFSFLFSF